MALKEKITADLKDALKGKKELEVSVLRMLLAAILNKEKEKRAKLAKEEEGLKEEELAKKSQLTDEEMLEVVSSEAKKRKEAIEGFSALGGPASDGEKDKIERFINKEKQELEILKEYLPEQLSQEKIKKLAQGAIEKVGATSLKDIGKVMADLMPKVQGKADGNTVSKIVKEFLS
ncbi:GatB/YqeY domain-containing protein [Patescibacteria group bacterium]|nr:GatB/YqeY domain-containing protein [Patescibacteria group bacterium]